MKRKIKLYLGITLLLIGVVILFIPGVYWFNYPELTQIQIYIELWYIPLIAFPCVFVGGYITQENL